MPEQDKRLQPPCSQGREPPPQPPPTHLLPCNPRNGYHQPALGGAASRRKGWPGQMPTRAWSAFAWPGPARPWLAPSGTAAPPPPPDARAVSAVTPAGTGWSPGGAGGTAGRPGRGIWGHGWPAARGAGQAWPSPWPTWAVARRFLVKKVFLFFLQYFLLQAEINNTFGKCSVSRSTHPNPPPPPRTPQTHHLQFSNTIMDIKTGHLSLNLMGLKAGCQQTRKRGQSHQNRQHNLSYSNFYMRKAYIHTLAHSHTHLHNLYLPSFNLMTGTTNWRLPNGSMHLWCQ